MCMRGLGHVLTSTWSAGADVPTGTAPGQARKLLAKS